MLHLLLLANMINSNNYFFEQKNFILQNKNTKIQIVDVFLRPHKKEKTAYA